MTLRIAMWSGPRNISTALMRAFDSRGDCHVIDEPLYAAYLAATGLDHPMRDEVLRSQPTDWREVVAALGADPPGGEPLVYQKHMTHHLLPEMGRDWLDRVESCFLIREPREVVASYSQKRGEVTLADLGMPQQLELFQRVCDRRGSAPPVLLASDVLRNPRGMLCALCAALGVAFSERMLSWPAGRRPTDGVWAAHWYERVERSTGFAPYLARELSLTTEQRAIADACMPFFEVLHAARLKPASPAAHR